MLPFTRQHAAFIGRGYDRKWSFTPGVFTSGTDFPPHACNNGSKVGRRWKANSMLLSSAARAGSAASQPALVHTKRSPVQAVPQIRLLGAVSSGAPCDVFRPARAG
ncbi:hypothetical protein VTH82DRAFT_3752 [Thermothelomyces myriococcoides]